MIPFMLTDSSVTIQFSDGAKTLSAQNAQFPAIMEALREPTATEWELKELFNLATAVKTYSHGAVQIKGDQVFYNGTEIKNSVGDRILRFMADGLPWQPLAAFLGNLMQNPSGRAVEYLYNFLEYSNLAITDDGAFLAYKAIRYDWMDKWNGTIHNHIGRTVEFPRNQVCDDPSQGCSYGLHIGSLQYVKNYGYSYGQENGDRIIIVKCFPQDVVSVPHDCEYQKVRTCRYTVLREYTGPLPEYEGIHVPLMARLHTVTFSEPDPEYTATSYTSGGVEVHSIGSSDMDVIRDFVNRALNAGLCPEVFDGDDDPVDLDDL